jgi:hypothetical protein
MSSQQKTALYFVFAVSYLAVALGAMRTYSSYRLFFKTYDITWVAGDIWLWYVPTELSTSSHGSSDEI